MTRIVVCCLVLFATTARAQPAGDLRATVGAWVTAHQPQIVKELVDLLSIPNVASDRPNIRLNAEHLRGMLAARGFKAELLETAGNPLVYGELTVAGATRTLLLYSHYDGQAVDPKAWKQASPFTPVLRTARVDRGGTDIPGSATLTRFESRVAPLRALGIRRQVADSWRSASAAIRCPRRVLASPDLERARHPRR